MPNAFWNICRNRRRFPSVPCRWTAIAGSGMSLNRPVRTWTSPCLCYPRKKPEYNGCLGAPMTPAAMSSIRSTNGALTVAAMNQKLAEYQTHYNTYRPHNRMLSTNIFVLFCLICIELGRAILKLCLGSVDTSVVMDRPRREVVKGRFHTTPLKEGRVNKDRNRLIVVAPQITYS